MPYDSTLPGATGEITAAWLTRALSSALPGVTVTEAEVLHVTEGTASRVRLGLSYNQAGRDAGLPPTLWFKSGFNPHNDMVADLCRREVFFYRDFAPRLALNLPKAYFAEVDASGRAVLLMEDLGDRGASFPGGPVTLTPDQTANALDELAQLHARFWQADELGVTPWLSGPMPHEWALLEFTEEAHWAECMAGERCAPLPPIFRDRARVREGHRRMLAQRDAFGRCLIHGDPHPGNMFIEESGKVGILDWQLAMTGNWAHDFAEFFCVAMTPADRRAHEREMMRFYLSRLAFYGVSAPDFDAGWRAFRQHILYTITWFIVPLHMQPLSVQAANGARWLEAALDHDPLEALGV